MSTPYLGEIRPFAMNYVPRGWLPCDGLVLPVNQYQALFAVIGTAYGGNGVTTFAVPDLRGRTPLGRGAPPDGVAGSYVVGQRTGTPTVTLVGSQLPVHRHDLPTSAARTSSRAAGNADAPGGAHGTEQAGTNGQAIGGAGGSPSAHDNLPPYAVLNFAIAVVGNYPARS